MQDAKRSGVSAAVVTQVIEPRPRDLGGFSVRRVLPSSTRPAVGPFVFLDEMGPARFGPGEGIDVRPHPHIGLATVTYLFEGEILHRDSLGCVQPIRPGAVNLMTAGRGIVHSERTAPEVRAAGSTLHGIQSWMALPDEAEEVAPAFVHHPAGTLPVHAADGVRATVIIGRALGLESPVQVAIETLYLDVALEAAGRLELPDATPERAVYVVEGAVRIGDRAIEPGTMAVLAAGAPVAIEAAARSRAIVLGGASPGPRHIWWNLVSSRRERIEQAKRDWVEGRFPPVPGEHEFIPLPSD
ncbi:MAG: pirin family protein [Ectothiorhodospiraceae bacterium]|nr:pirin family protein [Ectothiorhodospiraceae bacterium]